MRWLNPQDSDRPIRGKVLLAFVITIAGIFLSWGLTRLVFHDISGPVRHMAAPTEKLALINRLLEQVTKLDQLQRVQALKKHGTTRSFLLETQGIRLSLDTLQHLNAGNAFILAQIDSMRTVIGHRDKVYIQYNRLRSEQRSNAVLRKRIENLSAMVQANSAMKDQSVVSTEKSTVTTTLPPKEERHESSFFKKLFAKKKRSHEPEFVTREITSVKVDTLTSSHNDSMMRAIRASMGQMQREQARRSNDMLQRELRLISNGNALVNTLWTLLHRVQEEEINTAKANTDGVLSSLEKSINRTGIVLLLFFLLISALVYFTLADISKSSRYRKELKLAKEEAEELGRAKQRFLSNMSHEIRTPLQSIIGFSEQVQGSEKPDPEMLEAIHSSAGHLLQIVNEVLDYGRITSGKLVLERRIFNPHRLFNEVAAGIRIQADRKALRFRFSNEAPASKYYSGDDFRLKQVLYNLLGNAVKFTDTGEIGFSISGEAEGNFIITVSDTGTGIAQKDLGRIFNEFEQTDSGIARKFGGTGLGLSISKKLAEEMGGHIEVKSEPGTGTVFTFFLHLDPAAAEHTSADPLNLPAQGSAGKVPRVCVVDDDPFILGLCTAIFKKHRVDHTCYSSAEALLADRDARFPLVFADMRLTGMNGAALCHELKTSWKEPPVVIALTAQVLPDEREQLLGMGFDALLLKPFREHELLHFLNITVAPPQAGTDSGPGIDLGSLMKISMNDEELAKAHLNHFIYETTADLELLQEHLSAGDKDEITGIAHKLAGRSGQIGSKQLLQKYRAIETGLQKTELSEDWSQHISGVMEETMRLIHRLSVYISKDRA